MNRISIMALSIAAMPVLAGPSGGPYSIPWSTIDGGGSLNTTGGSFTLSGTIGQPDAGAAMTGGSFSLTGGFWAGVNSAPPCLADIDGNGALDFFDVSEFLLLYGQGNLIADMDGNGVLDFFDVSEFLLFYSLGCP